MTLLDLTPDELLSTTRSVRRRLDFERPVEPEVIEQCLRLAQQAPSGSNRQGWHFVVVADPARRVALADIYRRAWAWYREQAAATPAAEQARPDRQRLLASAQYLADRMHDAPVLVVPCIEHRRAPQPIAAQAGLFGSIIPAAWSFCLAARARGLGTCWTTLHLRHEEEAARILGIPYDDVLQVALIPVAYTKGTAFRPAAREPLARVVHWESFSRRPAPGSS